MSSAASTGALLIPEGGRLLHIGIPKTGTTALQFAANALRPQLRDLGVHYPGKHPSHFRSFYALLDHHANGGAEGASPSFRGWNELLEEIQREQSPRVFLSGEGVSQAADGAIDRIAHDLGSNTRIVITLRGLADRLPSAWQQRVRRGAETRTLDEWLEVMLNDEEDGGIRDYFYERNNRPAELAARWARVFGPEQVTVVMVDKKTPDLLYTAFETMLGTPEAMLRVAAAGDEFARLNRGMSPPEIELVRQVRISLREQGVTTRESQELLNRGAFLRLRTMRSPAPSEGKLLLPEWAANKAQEMAASQKATLAQLGVNVIGDLDILTTPVSSRTEGYPEVADVPMEVALEALLGLTARGIGRDYLFERAAAAHTTTTVDARRPSLFTRAVRRIRRLTGART